MNLRLREFRAALAEKRVLKVIAGIANVDLEKVLPVVRAADIAKASAVDVAATPEIVKAVRSITELPVVASCIQPKNLAAAVEYGADLVELGNYDALYSEGLFFTADEVLKLTEETLKLVNGRAMVSVTLPGHLSIDSQLNMLKVLEELGVDLIQTEGASRALSAQPQIKPLSMEEKAQVSLNNTKALVRATRLPVMTASGISCDNILEAFKTGASAVGVGSAVNKLDSEPAMVETVHRMMSLLSEFQSLQQHSKVS